MTATKPSEVVALQNVTTVCQRLGTGSAELQASRCQLDVWLEITVVRMHLGG